MYERKPKEILKAVAYIVGAMCDVDEKYLVEISQCSEKQLKALEKIVSSGSEFTSREKINMIIH